MRYFIMFLLVLAALPASAAQFEIQTAIDADITATTGTAVVTVTRFANIYTHQVQGPTEYKIAWTSSNLGNMTIATNQIQGKVLELRTDPDANAPSDNYDITILRDAVDVLNAGGINRHTSTTQVVASFADTGTKAYNPSIVGSVTITIANAGDANQGIIYLIVDER